MILIGFFSILPAADTVATPACSVVAMLANGLMGRDVGKAGPLFAPMPPGACGDWIGETFEDEASGEDTIGVFRLGKVGARVAVAVAVICRTRPNEYNAIGKSYINRSAGAGEAWKNKAYPSLSRQMDKTFSEYFADAADNLRRYIYPRRLTP